MVRAIAAALLAIAITTAANAQDNAPPTPTASPASTDVAKAVAELPDSLEELGQWCDVSELRLARSQVAKALIVLDPGNERGRAWLRFKRQKDGSWQQLSCPTFTNARAELLPEWIRRRAEAVDSVRAALTPTLGSKSDWHSIEPRRRLLRALIELDPEDKDLRERNGETLAQRKWILRESAATAAGRARIAEAVRGAIRSTSGLTIGEAPAKSWTTSFYLGGMCVHASLPKAEAVDVAIRVLQAREFLGLALDAKIVTSRRPDLCLLDSYAANPGYLRSRSDVSEEQRRRFETWPGYWLGEDLVLAYDDQPRRIDCAVRLVLYKTPTEAGYLGNAPDWISEGVGMYLTYALVGTRLTPFSRESSYSDATIWRELPDPRSDWVALARRMIDNGFDPKVGVLTGLPIASMTRDDGLMAYALAAYFLEGRPADLKQILVRLRVGSDFPSALAYVCGLDAEGLQERFIRWLHETK